MSVNIAITLPALQNMMRQLKDANVIERYKQSQLIYHLFDEHLDLKRRQTADTNLLINRTFRMQQRRNWTALLRAGVLKINCSVQCTRS